MDSSKIDAVKSWESVCKTGLASLPHGYSIAAPLDRLEIRLAAKGCLLLKTSNHVRTCELNDIHYYVRQSCYVDALTAPRRLSKWSPSMEAMLNIQ